MMEGHEMFSTVRCAAVRSLANALTNRVLPQPVCPNSRMPRGGDLQPLNRCGNLSGRMMPSLSCSIGVSKPIICKREEGGTK